MNYYAVLTDHGAQLIEQAYQQGQVVTITQMAIGDGGGVELEPAPSALAVAGEFDRVPLTSGASASSMLGGGVDYESQAHVGKWIRTLGLMDAQGNLIVYSNYPPTYIADKGSTLFRILGLNIQLPIVHGDAVTVIVERPPYPPATETEYGVVKLATQAQTDAGAADDVVVTPKKLKAWVKQATETVLGMLKVATQAQTDAGVADDVVVTPKKLKAWGKQATETVLGMLKVATQAQTDAGVADDVVVTPKKLMSWAKDASETITGLVRFATAEEAIAGTNSRSAMNPLRVMDSIKSMFVGIPLPWPMATPPSWGMIYQGQIFSAVENPILAQRYPSLVLPDLRAEFLRGLDAGRGKDPGRLILSAQSASLIAGETADRVVSLSRMQNVKAYYFDQLSDTTTQIAMSSAVGTVNNIQSPSSQYIGGARPTSVAFLWITIKG